MHFINKNDTLEERVYKLCSKQKTFRLLKHVMQGIQ